MEQNLPIAEILDDVVAAVKAGAAVLHAPPGAGKTTMVPLALLQQFDGKIIMLEPRRLAARAAAERMAELLGEQVGQSIGYRMRGDTRVSKNTRVEVITEGILTRMVQSDPGLSGVDVVIFDEFHERSLQSDLGLALVCEIREALRDDLHVLVMSATLDAQPIANLLEHAGIVRSAGRTFPVETRWLDKPRRADTNFTAGFCDLVLKATECEGGILAFLPGEREIKDVASRLAGRIDTQTQIMPLYGSLPFKEQRAAVLPAKSGRKIVLATSIAETSLTIEDVRVVVDGGLARRAEYNPASGMSRLITTRVSRAEAEQRRGRAGRVGPGVCFRFWAKAEEGVLPAFPPSEIQSADLTGFSLELAQWGASSEELKLLDAPSSTALSEAEKLLDTLGAIKNGRITEHGKAMAKIPAHPRLAHMMIQSDQSAAQLAAVLSETSRRMRTDDGDVETLLQHAPAAMREVKRLRPYCGEVKRSVGEMAALAYPDRVGLRRKGSDARFVLSGGKGAVMPSNADLAGCPMIVALDLDGRGQEARIRLAARLENAELRGLFAAQIEWETTCHWSKAERQIKARNREKFGALVLTDQIWKAASSETMAKAAVEGVKDLGLQALDWTKEVRFLRARVRYAFDETGEWPDWGDQALLDDAENWLAPFLSGVRKASDFKSVDLTAALKANLGWDRLAKLDRIVPAHITSPLGRKLALDYLGDVPSLEVRLQELFGLTIHPTVGPQKTPVKLTLLSPAQRPIQVTTDLPGFWQGSYADVRKDMRARYPKHPWPEDPTSVAPTLRAKPRK